MKTYDVVVIGSGLIGVSTAYEMAKIGRSVALLDAKGLSAGASTANTGMLLFEGADHGTAFDLCSDSIREYRQLEEELGHKTGFQKLGLITFFEEENEASLARPFSDFYRENGFASEILSAREVHELEPGLKMDTIVGGMFLEQWQMDPMEVIYGYFLKAREYGAEWFPCCGAEDFVVENGKITAVKTPCGNISGGQYVVAAGAWTRDLLKKLGIVIPEYYINGAAMICERGKVDLHHALYPYSTPRVAMEQNSSRLIAELGWENIPKQNTNEFVTLPDVNGNLMIAQRSHVYPGYTQHVPTDYIRDMAQNMLKYFPGFAESRVIRSWITPVPFVPGGDPFFGFAKPYDNLFISSGFASVLIMTPMIAKMTRAMLDGKHPGYEVGGWDPMRFSKEV